MTDEITHLHIQHLAGIYDLYRRMKSDPEHADKIGLMIEVARTIGQAIADCGGATAMRDFIDQFYAATQSDDAEDWLYRRWDGIRLPDGSVWVS